MKKKKVIVEIIGPGGSGKTTIAKKVSKKLNNEKNLSVATYENINIADRKNGKIKKSFIKFYTISKAFILKPWKVKVLIPALTYGKPVKEKLKNLHLTTRSIGIQERSKDFKGDVLLMDESSIRGIEGYVDSGKIPSEKVINKNLDLLESSNNKDEHLFVIINSTPEKIIKKRKKRMEKEPWRKELVPKRIIKNQKKTHQKLKKILKQKNIPVLEVENNKPSDIDKAADKIVKFIEPELKKMGKVKSSSKNQ